MPNPRQLSIATAAETKLLFPEIPRRSGTDPTSYFYPLTEPLPPLPPNERQKLRTAVIEAEPFNVSIDWQSHSFPPDNSQNTSSFPFYPREQEAQLAPVAYGSRAVLSGQRAPPIHYKSILQGGRTNRILVLNTANEREAGGGWEGGILAQEEEFSRRSNLVQTLKTTDQRSGLQSYYPIPHTGAIYSPEVVVFREVCKKGYTIWADEEWTTVSVVSAPAVRRPKTNESGTEYAFPEEKNLQKEKMKTILRVAALNGHINLVLDGFGSCALEGSGGGLYRNPVEGVCGLWAELLFNDEEFDGWFANIVFALGDRDGGGGWMGADGRSVIEFKKLFAL